MTKNQEDYLSMSQTTISFLQENETVWNGNASVAGVIADTGKQNDDLVDNQAEQEKDHSGITDEKKDDRTKTEDDIHTVSNVLSYTGAMINDTSLQGIVKQGTKDLSNISGEKLIGIAKITLETGTANLTKALSYGLTQLMLDSLDKNLQSFVSSINAPRIAITTAATATDAIAAGIDNLRKLLKDKLDKAMVLFKTNTAFYNQYKKVRTVVHSPTYHIAMTAIFTDAGGQALTDVKIGIDNGTDKVLRKSSPKGNIRVQNLLEGDHTMTAEKPGFEKQEIKFIVSSPDTVRLVVVMKAL